MAIELSTKVTERLERLKDAFVRAKKAAPSKGITRGSSDESQAAYREFIQALQEVYGRTPEDRTEEQQAAYMDWQKRADREALNAPTVNKWGGDELGKYTNKGKSRGATAGSHERD